MAGSLNGLTFGLIIFSYVFVIGYILVLGGVIYTLWSPMTDAMKIQRLLSTKHPDVRPRRLWSDFVIRAIGINRSQLVRCQLEHPQMSLWIVSGVSSLLGSYIPLGLVLIAFVATWVFHDKIMEATYD